MSELRINGRVRVGVFVALTAAVFVTGCGYSGPASRNSNLDKPLPASATQPSR